MREGPKSERANHLRLSSAAKGKCPFRYPNERRCAKLVEATGEELFFLKVKSTLSGRELNTAHAHGWTSAATIPHHLLG